MEPEIEKKRKNNQTSKQFYSYWPYLPTRPGFSRYQIWTVQWVRLKLKVNLNDSMTPAHSSYRLWVSKDGYSPEKSSVRVNLKVLSQLYHVFPFQSSLRVVNLWIRLGQRWLPPLRYDEEYRYLCFWGKEQCHSLYLCRIPYEQEGTI